MRVLTLLALPLASAALLLAGPAAADSPSPAATIDTAGTSFLTATTVGPGQPVRVSASTGDYLYWSFAASAGQSHRIAVTVAPPPAANLHGPATWTIDVFDGLRRRQSCTAGPQTVTAQPGDAEISLGCSLRRVRSWAEPWSSDPLPGTYYLRLSATDLPVQDLGLPIRTNLEVTARDGSAQPEGASMKAPLSPPVNPGTTLAQDAATSQAGQSVTSAPRPEEQSDGWFSGLSSRWGWTVGGGVLAALMGVLGYHLTRHPRRWFSPPR